MRTLRLSFAVLALLAVLTACTREEVPTQQVSQDGEYVGAKLLGTNISADFNFITDLQTKVDANGNFTQGDKLGLLWIVEESQKPWLEQTHVKPQDSRPYANHLFQRGADGIFTTYANVYEGWHAAYYPYDYQPMMGQTMSYTINPEQTDEFWTEVYTKRLHMSTLEFLTEAKNLDKTSNKLQNAHFTDFNRSVKALMVNLNFDDFKGESDEAKALQNLKIKSVTLKSGQKVFYGGDVELQLAELPEVVLDENDEYDQDATLEKFYNALPDVLGVDAADYTKTLTTNVEDANMTLGANQTVRFFTLPIDPATAPSANYLSLHIETDNGSFAITYKTGDELTDAQTANNGTLRKLARAFKVKAEDEDDGGYLMAYDAEIDSPAYETCLLGLGLSFTLTKDMFVPNFDEIESEDEWNNAVAVVNALGDGEEVEFTIKQGTQPWGFEGDANGLIKLPNVKLTVKGDDMHIHAAGVWPSQANFVVNTDVVIDENLTINNMTVNGEVTNNATITVNGTMDAESIVNKGVINANSVASISNKDDKKLDNSAAGAKVVVKHGAYVYPAIDKAGVIAYEVSSAKPADVQKINQMISSDDVKVNTLIVKTALDLNAIAATTDGDRYTEGSSTTLNSLEDVNVILQNKGSLIAAADGTNTKVYSVVAEQGTTSINGVEIMDKKLSVKAGKLTATNVKNIAVDYDITVEEGAELIIKSEDHEVIDELIVNGKATINMPSLTVNKLTVGANGTLVVADGTQLVWKTVCNIKAGSVTNGLVTRGVSNTTELQNFIDYAAENETVYLADKLILDAGQKITINKNITIDLNGHNLDASALTAARPFEVEKGKLVINAGKSEVAVGEYGLVNMQDNNNDKEVIINGGKFTGNTDNGSFIKPRGENWAITLNNVEYEDNGTGYIVNFADADASEITVVGGKFKAQGGFIGLTSGSSIKNATIETTSIPAIEGSLSDSVIEGCTVVTSNNDAITAGHNSKVTVKNCTVVCPDTKNHFLVYPTGGQITVTGTTTKNTLAGVAVTPSCFVYDLNAGVESGKIVINGEVKAEK